MITKNAFRQPTFIDTHCHLDLIVKGLDAPPNLPLTPEEYAATKTIIQHAAEHNVDRIITVGTTAIDSENNIGIAQYNTGVYAAVGLHPTNLTAEWQNELAHIEQLLKNKKENRIVAIGEIGIDLHHLGNFRDYQQEAFHAQIQLALKHGLPVLIHSRDAAPQTMTILQEYASRGLRGIMHCFAYDISVAKQVINWGLLIGISCTITRPNNRARQLVQQIDLNHIVLETDAPFLPPQHLRGKLNMPAYIPYAAREVSLLTHQSIEYIAQQTTANAQTLFGLTDKSIAG